MQHAYGHRERCRQTTLPGWPPRCAAPARCGGWRGRYRRISNRTGAGGHRPAPGGRRAGRCPPGRAAPGHRPAGPVRQDLKPTHGDPCMASSRGCGSGPGWLASKQVAHQDLAVGARRIQTSSLRHRLKRASIRQARVNSAVQATSAGMPKSPAMADRAAQRPSGGQRDPSSWRACTRVVTAGNNSSKPGRQCQHRLTRSFGELRSAGAACSRARAMKSSSHLRGPGACPVV